MCFFPFAKIFDFGAELGSVTYKLSHIEARSRLEIWTAFLQRRGHSMKPRTRERERKLGEMERLIEKKREREKERER